MPSIATEVDPSTIVWVWDKRALRHLVQYAIPTSDIVTFDLETTGLDEHAVTNGQSNGGVAARVVLASFTLDHDDRETTYVVPLSHPQSPLLGQWRKVSRLLAQAMRGKKLVGHNVKFDCRWLFAVTGVDLAADIHWDTMLSAHLLDENVSHKLKEVAPKAFGIERWDDFSLNRPGAAEQVDLFQLGEYAALDTIWTYRLYQLHYFDMVDEWTRDNPPVFPEEVEIARLGQLAELVTMPTSRTLTAIEQRGLILDTEWVSEERDRLQALHTQAFSTLASKYAGEIIPGADGAILDASAASFAPTALWFADWAAVAVAKGDLRVGALTPTGKPQWSKSVLQRQARAGSEVADLLLQLRDASKKAEFLESWLQKVSPDGRIHATYNVGSVSTGRLSSSGPNMQQVTKALRPAFKPSPGYHLAEIDYSQIELRVAAYVSGCKPMIEAFRNGEDLHLLIAGRTNHEKAIQAAHLYLLWCGLPADRTGAQVLRELRSREGSRGVPEEVATILREAHPSWSGEESRLWQRWCTDRGIEPSVERRSESVELPEVSQELLRELRSHFQRVGWPWQGEDHAGRPPSQPRPYGQQAIELEDAMPVLSSAGAQRLQELTGDPWKQYRQQGKAQNFGLVYGMGAAGFREYAEDAYGVVMSEEEAQNAHAAFFATWEGLREWHSTTGARLSREHQAISPIGRIRRLSHLMWDEYRAQRAAINSPVQGFASDIMQIAASLIEGMHPNAVNVREEYGARLVGTVHDSILVEVPQDNWRGAVAACQYVMETSVLEVLDHLGCLFDVPLVADATVGSAWGLEDVD